MSETIVVFLIAGIAFILSARWFYRTLAGKAEGCVCGESDCSTRASCNEVGNGIHCKEG